MPKLQWHLFLTQERRAYINVIIDKESYKKENAGEILEEWFDGSAKELISAISGNIKKDDTEELKGILDGFDFKQSSIIQSFVWIILAMSIFCIWER